MRAGDLIKILQILDEDTDVFVQQENLDEVSVKSWQIRQYHDKAEVILSSDSMFGLDI